MRAILSIVLLVALPFAAPVASAGCEVATVPAYPDINYTTVCVATEHVYGDGTQTFDNTYLAHASHAVEADPAFNSWYLRADQGLWTYDDGEVQQEREWTHIGSGSFAGVRGLVGTGYQANFNQRDQTAPEDAGDWCSSHLGQSTCLGASAWFTVQDVAGVGVGVYYHQTGEGDACVQGLDVGATLLVVYVPVTSPESPCAAQAPNLYDEVSFRGIVSTLP